MVGVAGHELLGFGAKGQVGEEDVAFLAEESAREGEVDPWALFVRIVLKSELEAPWAGRERAYLIPRL